jgi:hypothetical protein
MNAARSAGAILMLIAVAGFPAAGSRRPGPALGPDARDILRGTAGFTDTDFAAVDRGQVVVKVLTTDRREVAVAGAVRIDGRREALVDRMRTVENLKRSDMVLAVGTFSRPPRADDLHALPFEDYDLDIRTCRPGDCKVRLSAESIARFQREVNWSSPQWRNESAAVWRRVLAEYAADYATHGASALARYDNKKESLSVRQEYSTLLGESAFIAAVAPEFYAYLQDESKVRLATAEDLLYWSKEDFSIRPVMRITHQTIYRPSASPGSLVLIATKQIYGTHYIDAALGITLALDTSSTSSSPGFYMVTVNRARTRSLSGFLRGMVRSVVQNRSRDALEKILKATKVSLETKTPGRSH